MTLARPETCSSISPMNHLGRHRLLILAAGCAIAAIAAASFLHRDLILFNHSPSIPIGLYLRTDHQVTAGAIVTVRARHVAPEEARRRRFSDETDRFIKRVAAVGGTEVCGDESRITIGGAVIAERHPDANVPLGWSGCRVLAEDEVLLLGESTDSFDGRYWGPTNVTLIEGVWRKL
jgi:type IV secretory pathway protease TraF